MWPSEQRVLAINPRFAAGAGAGSGPINHAATSLEVYRQRLNNPRDREELCNSGSVHIIGSVGVYRKIY